MLVGTCAEDYIFIESFESRQSDEWVDLIKTLNREKLDWSLELFHVVIGRVVN